MRITCSTAHDYAVRFLLVFLLAASGAGATAHAAGGRLDGADSVYGKWLVRVERRWPAGHPLGENAAPVNLTCLATVNDDKYVGMRQRAIIGAPLTSVEGVLDDVAHYRDLFPGVVDVHVLPGSQHGRRFVTAWEQRVPVFFLPNVHYELAYLVDKSNVELGIYRYTLRRGEKMVGSDGMVVLEAVGPGATRFTEYDFFKAQWGPLPAALVWRESLRSAFLSDVAIKLKVENPAWTYERIASEAQRLLGSDAGRITQCYQQRRTIDLGTTH
jgi:hypothetical protein